MTRLLLIRHGETASNAERRLQGHLDIALNDTGRAQAAALAEALGEERIDAIVSSDLKRAHATACAIARAHRLAVQQDDQLRERCYGAFEGLLYSDIEARYPREFAAWQARDIDAVPPAGAREAESFRQFCRRSLAALLYWGGRYRGQTLALVAHGGVLECAHRAALGMPYGTPRSFTIPNASINRFRIDNGRLVLDSWGETAHLDARALDEVS
jgi:probable phosphoglycerate mutase